MTKFDRLMQNDLLMAINRSKSKPEAQFQYGGRPFSETGSSFILPWIEISHQNLASKWISTFLNDCHYET